MFLNLVKISVLSSSRNIQRNQFNFNLVRKMANKTKEKIGEKRNFVEISVQYIISNFSVHGHGNDRIGHK